jgi:16S rRNA A1518/A1519 N6-dimethyltransferase RsmA/KsgA/DIM1 with predicted DNA glycosylase/AP lyase activity
MMAKKAIVSEEILVSPDNFVPAPNVQSSVLKFVKHNNFLETDDEIFLRFIKI